MPLKCRDEKGRLDVRRVFMGHKLAKRRIKLLRGFAQPDDSKIPLPRYFVDLNSLVHRGHKLYCSSRILLLMYLHKCKRGKAVSEFPVVDCNGEIRNYSAVA